jgi:DNA (cytosine-5)-methyltransferase 1
METVVSRPLLLDLFCGAGGAAMGYHRAGFDVVGVDIDAQPNYPFEVIQADALEFMAQDWDQFSYRLRAIHASPPCQSYSRNLKHMAAVQPMLIEPVRRALVATGLPWVIENVEGAPMPDQDDLFGRYGIVLCGTAFGMRVYRHRWFESSMQLVGKGCNHSLRAMNPHNVAGRKQMYAEFGRQDPEILWRDEMGVGWMGRYEAREAIPPAYTEFIGGQLLESLNHLEVGL